MSKLVPLSAGVGLVMALMFALLAESGHAG
jgi:hypothetical protein